MESSEGDSTPTSGDTPVTFRVKVLNGDTFEVATTLGTNIEDLKKQYVLPLPLPHKDACKHPNKHLHL